MKLLLALISVLILVACGGNTVPTLPTASSNALIDADLAAGKINLETALTYKTFAIFGDNRLPAQYASTKSMGEATQTISEIQNNFAAFSEPTKDIVKPFLLRPNNPDSWLSPQSIAVQGTRNLQSLVDRPQGNFTSVVSSSSLVRVWWSVAFPEYEAKAQALAAEIDNVVRNLFADPEARLQMRYPVSDQGVNGSLDYAIDIYLLVRTKSNNYAWAQGDTSTYPRSGFISVPIDSNLYYNNNPVLFAAVAHEVFHLSQFAYKQEVTSDTHWWREATATWSEDYIYPKVNTEHVYVDNFMDYPELPLNFDDGEVGSHEYGAYLFPFLIARKYNPDYIRKSWENIEKYPTLEAIDKTLAELGGFKEVFPQFTLNNLNVAPVDYYHQQDEITYQLTKWKTTLVLDGASFELNTEINPLIAGYTNLQFTPESKSITITNNLVANEHAQVWLIPTIDDVLQAPQNISREATTSFCRNNLKENLTEILVVVTNSDWANPAGVLPRDKVTVEAKNECSNSTGILHGKITFDGNYNFTEQRENGVFPEPGYGKITNNFSGNVHIEANITIDPNSEDPIFSITNSTTNAKFSYETNSIFKDTICNFRIHKIRESNAPKIGNEYISLDILNTNPPQIRFKADAILRETLDVETERFNRCPGQPEDLLFIQKGTEIISARIPYSFADWWTPSSIKGGSHSFLVEGGSATVTWELQ